MGPGETFRSLVSRGEKGCVIFDDLMSECGLLVDLFTKFSSHSLTIIHITQNVFVKSVAKHGTDNVTIFRNTQVLVLFRTPMGMSVLMMIAKQISHGENTHELFNMFMHISDNHRYLVIVGNLNTPHELKYQTDIFSKDPIPNQTVFSLLKK